MLGRSHFRIVNHNNLTNIKNKEIPILKVGIIEQRDTLDFKVTGKFSVLNDQGIAILKGVTAPTKWRLKIKNRQQAKYEYSILLEKYYDLTKAEEQEYKLIEKGIGARIKNFGAQFIINNKLACDNTEYWLVIDKLTSEQEANNFAEEMVADFSYKIIKEKVNEPHALLELFDNELEKLGQAENSFRVVPESAEVLTYIYDLTLKKTNINKTSDYAAFQGSVEFRCLDDGKIAAICEKTIEEYVKSVVTLQMAPNLPKEIIKAQAVVVRTKAISKVRILHYDDPFELCSGEHCQIFTGVFQIPSIIIKAVEDTVGLVLTSKNRVADVNYTTNCGGHTESTNFVNSEVFENPYPPIFDSVEQKNFEEFKDLALLDNLKKWINHEPDTFCNLKNNKNQNVPNFLKNNFRWHITYDRDELEKIISNKTGFDIGALYDIFPVSRGISGRLKELEILASNKNLLIKNQSEICDVLAQDRLPSSCFIVESQMDEQGFPTSFTFRGAGFGHGVGLCQAGGTGMALKGADYSEILKHYFQGTKLRKIYEV